MEDTTYNGWKNYQTWNVALWIGNDEGLYYLAKAQDTYHDFITTMRDQFAQTETPDRVAYNDSSLDFEGLDEMISGI